MTNLDVIKRLYASFAARDKAAILEIFHPDLEWNQNEGFPGGGKHVGVDAVFNIFRRLRTDWAEWRADVYEYVDGGSTVIALGDYVGKHKTTGKPVKAAFAHVYRLKDGRIVHFRQYTDTHLIQKAMS